MEQHLKKRILGAFVTVIAVAIANCTGWFAQPAGLAERYSTDAGYAGMVPC